jgi:hypothetical protein
MVEVYVDVDNNEGFVKLQLGFRLVVKVRSQKSEGGMVGRLERGYLCGRATTVAVTAISD